MKLRFLLALLCAPSLALADGSLGSKDPGLLNLKGEIYFLDEGTDVMPEDLAKRKVQGVIYTDRLDVAPRDFDQGFPGVTDRFEWFGVVYTGTFEVTQPGDYKFRTLSDDGSMLWIDDKEVVANDGIHGPGEGEGDITLAKGLHKMRVWYFQGPATTIALQLFITPPKGTEKIFVLGDYAATVAKAIQSVSAKATPQGILVQLDAAVLFDLDKAIVKPAAQKALADVAELIRSYPAATVVIGGHTDSLGDDKYNQTLSEKRAQSVQQVLAAAKLPAGVKLMAQGHGEGQPVAPNDVEKNRAKNRRVEILIKP
jgi:outer membrane protein OmpA-like peptidoglycan-associated protein